MENENLQKQIENLLNSASAENQSNTPDFILAEYLMQCLRTFEHAVNRRSVWYGETDFLEKIESDSKKTKYKATTFYKPKSESYEAIKFNGSTTQMIQIQNWVGGAPNPFYECVSTRDMRYFKINVYNGEYTVAPGDYVVKDMYGNFFVFKPKDFEEEFVVDETKTLSV